MMVKLRATLPMIEDTTLTIRLSSETGDGLATLAERTHRARSTLAAEAVADYVARELEAIEAVERGRADLRAGRYTSHDDVSREARAVIKAARAGR